MLLILYGPSCVGKTTIIKKLCELEDIDPIMCYTTRKSRESDFARISIADIEFESMKERNEFLIVNEHLGAKYGNIKEEFQKAVSNNERYFIIDYMIKDYLKFESFKPLNFVVLPKNETQLLKQIENAGRLERRSKIIKDYKTNYSEIAILNSLGSQAKIVINYENEVDRTVENIYEEIKNNGIN